jgi:DNA mismatch repair protein MSH4
LIITPKKATLQTTEQAINQIIMLKHFVGAVNPIYEALTGTRSSMLDNIRELCAPENVAPIQELINRVINEDTTYAKQPLELRNQRIYAVKSGVNGLLDVARTTYREASEDTYQHCTELGRERISPFAVDVLLTTAEEFDFQLELKYDNARQFYIKIPTSEVDGRALPPIFTNIIRRGRNFECQTLELMKRNQKVTSLFRRTSIELSRTYAPQINVSHQEVILMSA